MPAVTSARKQKLVLENTWTIHLPCWPAEREHWGTKSKEKSKRYAKKRGQITEKRGRNAIITVAEMPQVTAFLRETEVNPREITRTRHSNCHGSRPTRGSCQPPRPLCTAVSAPSHTPTKPAHQVPAPQPRLDGVLSWVGAQVRDSELLSVPPTFHPSTGSLLVDTTGV